MDDSNIVELYWQRNESAISETQTKYGRYCFSIAQAFLGNRQDSEECVNDTYISAWNAIPPHRPVVLSTFLGKITRRLSLKSYAAAIRQSVEAKLLWHWTSWRNVFPQTAPKTQ